MTGSVAYLHDKLVAHIVDQDRKAQNRAARTGKHFNHYAMGIMLKAAQDASAEALEDGGSQEDWVKAVARNFSPTRSMHTSAGNVGGWEWSNETQTNRPQSSRSASRKARYAQPTYHFDIQSHYARICRARRLLGDRMAR